jgi:RAT1-interacting protein
MNCRRVGNEIILEVFRDEKKESDSSGEYIGYSLENLLTGGKAGDPIDPNQNFCTVVTRDIGPYRLVIGAEIDATATGEPDLTSYVEIKAARTHRDARDSFVFHRHKLFRYWLQSHIVGVPKVLVAYRDANDIVMEPPEEILTDDMPKRGLVWKPYFCHNLLYRFLVMLEQNTQDDQSYTVYFDRPYTHIILKKQNTTLRE